MIQYSEALRQFFFKLTRRFYGNFGFSKKRYRALKRQNTRLAILSKDRITVELKLIVFLVLYDLKDSSRIEKSQKIIRLFAWLKISLIRLDQITKNLINLENLFAIPDGALL